MKRFHTYIKQVLRYALGGVTLAFASGLLVTACVSEPYVQDDLGRGDEAWVLLTVRTPSPAAVGSRQAADPESDISDLRILVLEESGGNYAFSYQENGTMLDPVGGQQRFRVRLRATSTPTKLMIAANAEAAFASFSPAVGTPEADIRSALELAYSSAGLSGNLPMFGEVLLGTGIGTGTQSVQATMLRAVARVDVVKNLDTGTDDFTLEAVYVYRANDKIRVAYDPLTDPTVPVVDEPSIPSDAAFLTAPVSKAVVPGEESITQIYVPESYVVPTSGNRLTGTTVVVVGGRWGGGTNPITYYRADFDPDLSGQDFGQLLRNHRYIFSIKRVSAQGWGTPLEAANNLASSIVVSVQAWQDFSSDMHFGQNRFAISSREIALRFVGDRQKRLDVESTLEYTIQWLDGNDRPVGDETSDQNVVISNADFDVSIVKDTGDPDEVTHLLFRTRHNNHNGNVIGHKLRITVDNWSVDITVSQDNTAVYSNRHFNVLSGIHEILPVGHLGTTSVLPTQDAFQNGGVAMRQILDHQFVPGSIIGIGGFAFDQVNDNTTYLGLTATTGTNYDAIRRIIRMQNVIYLSYDVRISTQVANVVLEWLDGNPRRVLIVGTDGNNTNANMRMLLSADGTWLFNNTTGAFKPAAESDATTEFFSGPFGNVDVNASFAMADQYSGYSLDYPTSVTPLIVSNLNTNAMVFGVNKTRRIIYHGDANLFQASRLSNNNGDVGNDLDRLMANVWAWIVEQLVYGPPEVF